MHGTVVNNMRQVAAPTTFDSFPKISYINQHCKLLKLPYIVQKAFLPLQNVSVLII
uniref:Uncharacterized protein n=1 Tax=Arundo donax TaxID=35708 RepID=A0A0A8ZQ72_ARUDO